MPLSSRQCEYLALAWQCFEAEPKIDYEKFREVAGLASAASARELMRTTKKKLKEEYGALGASVRAGKTASTKATPQKKLANGDGTPGSAQGKKRGRGLASASGKKTGSGLMVGLDMVGGGGGHGEDEDDEEEEEIQYEMKSPSKKRARVNGGGGAKAAMKSMPPKTVATGTDGDADCEKDSEAAGADAGAETWDGVRVKAEPKPSDFGLEDALGGGWFSP